MYKLVARLLLALVALTLIVSVPAAAQTAGAAQIRFVHVIPGANAIDVYIDGSLVINALDYGSPSFYLNVPAQPHTITVTQSGVTTELWQQEVVPNAGAAYTLVASSTNPLGFQNFQDDLTPLALGSSRLTAIHAIANATPVDVVLADGRAVIPGLQYNIPYGTLDIPSAVYALAVTGTGEPVDDALIPVTSLALNSGTSYMALAYGTPASPELLLLEAPTQASEAAGWVRFVHGLPEAEAVDVLVNEVVVAPSLEYGVGTGFVALPAGDHEVSVRAAGEADDLLTEALAVEADTYSTAVVTGDGENVALSLTLNDATILDAQQASLQVINLTATSADIALSDAPSTSLTEVAAQDTGEVTTSAAETGFVVVQDGAEASFEPEGGLYGGALYTALVTTTDAAFSVVFLAPAPIAVDASSSPRQATINAPIAVAQAETAVPAAEVTTSVETTTETAEATEVVVEATEAVTPSSEVIAATPTLDGVPTIAAPATANPTARVLVDPGANLQLRQYPNSQALSLGRAPSGAVLEVIGREGAFQPLLEATADLEATPYVDPATTLGERGDLDPNETWLYVIYTAPDGGTIEAWANALYLAVTQPDGRAQRLADLPTIPSNRFGTSNTTFQPTLEATQPFQNQVVGTVVLNAGANLNLRLNPSTSAGSIALIPSGTQFVVTGQNESGDWLQAEYQGQTGWVSSTFVTLTYNGVAYRVASLPVVVTVTQTAVPTLDPNVLPTATPGA